MTEQRTLESYLTYCSLQLLFLNVSRSNTQNLVQASFKKCLLVKYIGRFTVVAIVASTLLTSKIYHIVLNPVGTYWFILYCVGYIEQF